jgi:hypothetical protein
MEPVELPPPNPDERLLAMLAHILQIVSWFIGPLVIFLVKRESHFVRFHALQALIWQAVCAAFWVIAMVVFFASWIPIMVSQPGPGSHRPPIAFFVGFLSLWLLGMGAVVLNLVLGIVYGIKANNGEWAGYPIIGRWARRFSGA